MFAIEPNDKTIFIVPVGYGVIVFGLVAFTMGTFGPLLGADVGRGIQFAIFAGAVISLLVYHDLAKAYRARWHQTNEMIIARLRRTAAQYSAEAESYANQAADTANDGDTAGHTTTTDDTGASVRVNELAGSYLMARMTEAERAEGMEIGECIRFIGIGVKAKIFSLRGMSPHRPAGWSENRFEKWWTDRGNALVAWGLFEKVGRSTTRPANGRTPDEVRRALLQRNFPARAQTAVAAGQTGQGQTV